MNKYTCNSSKGCVLEVDLEYPKELRGLHNDYPLAPVKIEFTKKMLSEHQLMISDLNNISIGNVKKLVPKVFGKNVCASLCVRLPLQLKTYIAY